MLSLILILVGLAIVCYALWNTRQNHEEHSTIENPTTQTVRDTKEERAFYGPVSIYYASQTGTAARFAKNLVQDAKLNDIVCVARCIDECSLDDLKEKDKLAIFLISTHYEGEPTDDMVAFWKAFSKLKDTSLLSSLNYTGFSLGDLNYKYFNQMGRLLNKKLEELGAKKVYEFGEGSNHINRIEEYFEEWNIPLWNNMLPILSKINAEVANEIWDSSDPSSFIVSILHDNKPVIESTSDLKYQPETEVEESQ